MPDLTIQVQEPQGLSGTALVVLNGSIDAKTVITFQTHLNSVKMRGFHRFILDMENVRYVNSTGLGYLINLSDSVGGTEQGTIALVKIQPKVRVVFDMLGLNAFFKIYNTVDDAVRFFASNGTVATATVAPPPTRTETASPGVAPKRPVSSSSVPTLSTSPAPKPQRIECRTCHAMLSIREAGAYKCPRCFTVFHYVGGGRASFLPRKEALPAQLSLNFSDECTKGLLEFVRLMVAKSGFSADETSRVQDAVRDAVTTICQHAYGGEAANVYHVLLMAQDTEIEIKFADYGRPIDVKDPGAKLFAPLRGLMDRFDLKNNPKGGNVLTVAKKKK